MSLQDEQIVVNTVTASRTARLGGSRAAANRPRGLLGNYFYFSMSLLILAIVVYGFSFTVSKNLIHSTQPGQVSRYVHAFVFSAWLLFFIVQSVLVRARNVRLHRALGWFGVANGVAVVAAGVWVTVRSQPRIVWPAGFFSMVAFGACLALAVYWRRKPELHRRLLLVGTCVLTNAAFARFPFPIVGGLYGFAWADTLLLLGMGRDLWVDRRVHPVYLWVAPLLVGAELAVLWPFLFGGVKP